MYKVFDWKFFLFFFFSYLLIAGGLHLTVFPDVYIWEEYMFWFMIIITLGISHIIVGIFFSEMQWISRMMPLYIVLAIQCITFTDLRDKKIKEYISLAPTSPCMARLVGYTEDEFTFSVRFKEVDLYKSFSAQKFPDVRSITIDPQKGSRENILVIGTPEIFEEMDCYDTVYPTTGERLVGFQMKS